jgi:hypothetical protein
MGRQSREKAMRRTETQQDATPDTGEATPTMPDLPPVQTRDLLATIGDQQVTLQRYVVLVQQQAREIADLKSRQG